MHMKKKEITLVLDLRKKRDNNMYWTLKDFAKKHAIEDESDALKAFLVYVHFLAADVKAITEKVKYLF